MPYKDPQKKAERSRKYYKENKELILSKDRLYYEAHREEKKKYQKSYSKNHREELKKKRNKTKTAASARKYYKLHKAVCRLRNKEYVKKNRERVGCAKRKYYHSKIISNISFRLGEALRHRLYAALKNGYKSGSAVRDLGCSINEFKLYLEKQFIEGMTWDNYGRWHIDHIIPLSAFDLENREQFLQACHYTNLQPLWEIENLKKSNKIIYGK